MRKNQSPITDTSRNRWQVPAVLGIIGLLGIAFLSVVLLQTWDWTQKNIEQTSDNQARLAVEFGSAIRHYVAQHVRPEMEKRVEPGEFIPETMSTSFVARSVFNRVHEKFPDYLLRFPSTNPRNPANTAHEPEKAIVRYFEENPQADSWSGTIELDGQRHFVRALPRRFETGCLRCHGRPEEAPASIVQRYGDQAGFGRSVGQVSIDLAGIPVDTALAAAKADVHRHMRGAVGLFVAFLAAIAAVVLIHTRQRARYEETVRQSEQQHRLLIDKIGRASCWERV